MDPKEVFLVAIMVLSATTLTYKWLSIYNNVDVVVVFSSFLLVFSLGCLLISLVLRIQKIKEELESTKRIIAANSYNLEERIENKIAAYIDTLDERLETIERRIYK